ncbi:sodium:solute symporter family protein [Cardinium endosymbiont of Nabis limbatus]|uniref:sodium:solute symporter family protein n=1 Tax=Cardinium endosymbiont of Nabis limbatus TaxID=3066217 RepID=UPI003AF3CE7F
MRLYTTTFLMVLAFLLLTLVVGLYVSQKPTTFRTYAVGNKRFHTTTLVVTILATVFGGGALMRELPNVHELGIHRIVFLCARPVSFWIMSLLGLRMGPFMEHLSVAETIGSVYGKYPRIIAALLGICFSLGIVSIQINVMSSAITMCIDSIDPRMVTILATLILITYSIFGGVRAITITDILQFATFTIIIPLIIKLVFLKTDQSFLGVVSLLQKQEKFQLSKLFHFDKKLMKLVFDDLSIVFMLTPSVLQRAYMASGPIQVYKAFLRVTLFSFIIFGAIVLIALLVFIGNPTLSATEIWPYILADISPVYKGCVLICLLGMTMSTADSSLHAAAIMVSHDMVESIRGIKVASYLCQLRVAKITTLVVGLLAMIVTVYYPDLFELTSFVFTFFFSFFVGSVIPLFILAVFGFRGSTHTALIGMGIAVLVDFSLEQYLKPKIGICFAFFPLIANFLAMMVAHYLLPQPAGKGWIGHSRQQKRMQQLIQAFKKYKKSIDLE